MSELPDPDPEAAKVLSLIDASANLQIERDLKTLERISALGDQVAARIITMQTASKENTSSDPLE